MRRMQMEHNESENKIRREVQLNAEKAKLEEVIKIINDEMLKNISKRKK